MELLPEHRKMVEDIAVNNGFKNYEIETEPGSEKGDGYTGTMVKVTIKNDDKQLKVILKLAHSVEGPHAASISPFITTAYLKEMYMYDTVFGIFDKFQRDNGLTNGFNFHAKLYGKCTEKGKEGLAMENLIESGLKLWNRRVPMDARHIALVLREYGKLHAVPLALRDKKPEVFSHIVKSIKGYETYNEDNKVLLALTANIVKSASRIAKGDIAVENAIKRLPEVTKTIYKEKDNPEYNIVINHGDCWCNNMLFKYEDPNDVMNPTKVCLIDWQLIRLGNPVGDISYFFGTSSPKDILDQHHKYLKIYHDSLSDSLKAMGCDPSTVYPFSKLMDHWKKFAKVMAYLAPIVFNILTAEKEDVVEISEMAEMGNFIEQLGNKQSNIVDNRTYDVFKFLTENDLI